MSHFDYEICSWIGSWFFYVFEGFFLIVIFLLVCHWLAWGLFKKALCSNRNTFVWKVVVVFINYYILQVVDRFALRQCRSATTDGGCVYFLRGEVAKHDVSLVWWWWEREMTRTGYRYLITCEFFHLLFFLSFCVKVDARSNVLFGPFLRSSFNWSNKKKKKKNQRVNAQPSLLDRFFFVKEWNFYAQKTIIFCSAPSF